MRITIYTRNDCVQCHATKRAMENRGFDFEMILMSIAFLKRQKRCVLRAFVSCR